MRRANPSVLPLPERTLDLEPGRFILVGMTRRPHERRCVLRFDGPHPFQPNRTAVGNELRTARREPEPKIPAEQLRQRRPPEPAKRRADELRDLRIVALHRPLHTLERCPPHPFQEPHLRIAEHPRDIEPCEIRCPVHYRRGVPPPRTRRTIRSRRVTQERTHPLIRGKRFSVRWWGFVHEIIVRGT